MRLHELLEGWATRQGHQTALIEGERCISYAELDALANRFARALCAAGVAETDRVVIALDNSVEQVAAYLGVLKAGGIAVPLPAGARSDRLAAAVRDCTPRACIVDPPTVAALPNAGAPTPTVLTLSARPGQPLPTSTIDLRTLLETAGDGRIDRAGVDTDLAAIVYTSGSTGEPRGVMLSHRNFVSNARAIVEYLGLSTADRAMCVLPFYYVYGLSVLHSHLMVGASVVIDNRFAYPNVVLEAMQRHNVTGFAGVPSTFALLLHRSNLATTSVPTLRYVTQAGGHMPPHNILAWLERGPNADFFVMYGATEAAARLTYMPPRDLRRKLGSIGVPIPSVTIDVVRDDGSEAGRGEVGELVARGPNIARGYWNRPDETAARFGPAGYRTGDLGYKDEEGFLFLVGRLHDMIKVGAHRVGAKEIEDVLHAHSAVVEAVVVAAPHALQGEVPVAFVVLDQALADAERQLQAHCAARLAPYKVPARVVTQAALDKLGGTGKIDRSALRERALQLATPVRS